MEEFNKRVFSSIIGIPLILTAIYLGGPVYLLFVEIVIIAGLAEYLRLVNVTQRGLKLASFSAVVLLSLLIYLNNGQNQVFHQNPADLLTTIFLTVIVLIAAFYSHSTVSWQQTALAFTGVFYIGWTLSYLLLLREEFSLGREYTYLLFFTIWAVDVAAYVLGKKFGKTKLAPSISPNKSWEGAFSGILAGIIAGSLVKIFLLPQKTWLSSLGLILVITILAQLSDLAESALKRNFDVKDSGGLIPGHGGILDRFDSFILTGPLVYYIIKWIL
ncbi:MAG: phosphatidate cytidylyltransferase [bacterium]|nr:phosphatidate cytidylyltransferase [bacterium]